jgi:hypothetical protein
MLTVEERHEIIQAFESVAALSKGLAGGGIDHALRVAIIRENTLRGFYEVLNTCTDWGMVVVA